MYTPKVFIAAITLFTTSAAALLAANVFHGDGTYYAVGLGSCGKTNKPSDPIIAVSHLLYDTWPGANPGNPNKNPICGRKAIVKHGSHSVTVTVEDRCMSCAKYDLDFSTSAFQKLAPLSVGRLHGIQWQWA